MSNTHKLQADPAKTFLDPSKNSKSWEESKDEAKTKISPRMFAQPSLDTQMFQGFLSNLDTRIEETFVASSFTDWDSDAPLKKLKTKLDLISDKAVAAKIKNRDEGFKMFEERMSKNAGIRILCLDGGGMRGLIEIQILKHISQEIFGDPSGVKLINQFDLICGTSAGGILTLALSQGFDLKTCKGIFEELGTEIFDKGPIDNMVSKIPNFLLNGNLYSTDNLEKYLKTILGTDPIGESIKKPIFVVTSDTTEKESRTVLFRSYEHGRYKNSKAPPSSNPIKDVDDLTASFPTHKESPALFARVTSAAPAYFKGVQFKDRIFVDGGITANNPTELAFFEAKTLWPERKIDLILSLGTGKPSQETGSQNIIYLFSRAIDICTSSEDEHFSVKNWVKFTTDHPSYFRFSPDNGEGGIGLDESDRKILENMQKTTLEYMQRMNEDVQKLKSLMLDSKTNHPL